MVQVVLMVMRVCLAGSHGAGCDADAFWRIDTSFERLL